MTRRRKKKPDQIKLSVLSSVALIDEKTANPNKDGTYEANYVPHDNLLKSLNGYIENSLQENEYITITLRRHINHA